MQSTIGKDRKLSARMLLTLFLMGALYVGFFAFMVSVLHAGIGLIIGICAVMLFCQYYFSDKLALMSMRAKVVEPDQAPELHAMVERLSMQAGIPKPRVAIAETSMPNAFATGRSRKHSTVCATTGIMETLTPDELEGVMAHELSHVLHRDVAIMTAASFLGMVAGMLAQWGFFFTGGGDDEDSGPSFIVIFLVSMLVYAISFVLMNALSRYREYAADRGAAILTGKPGQLANALLRIHGKMETVPRGKLQEAQTMNAFFILPAKVKESLSEAFSTHPHVEKRVARLRAMEDQIHGVTVRVGDTPLTVNI